MAREFSFFDPDEARGPSEAPDVGRDVTAEILAGRGERTPWSVSALIGRIKGALGEAFPQSVAVVGELSNVKLHTSGHLYCRLKDASASIDVAMFRQHARRLKFRPTDGLEVVIDGRVDVYDVRGQLQLYAEQMTPKGAGALELAFRQLCEKLQAEGLFDADRKKPVPRFPRAVGVVTSATGAAVRDIRRTLGRRWPAARVYLVPVLVQGEGAAEQIAEAISLLDAAAARYEIDTLIVARGGGSLEDLWAFNEEVVARAIFAAATPIISGVGHEVDVTIADMTADLRAPTPTGAAELAVPDARETRRHVAQLAARLRRKVLEDLRRGRAELEAVLRSAVFRDPTWRLRTQAQRLDELAHRLRAGAAELLARYRAGLEPKANRLAAMHPMRLAERARGRLERLKFRLRWALGYRSKSGAEALAGLAGRLRAVHPRHRLALARRNVAAIHRQLEAMSYRSALMRGFSVTRLRGGAILRSAGQVRAGQSVETELADGRFRSVVDGRDDPPPDGGGRGDRKRRGRTDDSQRRLFE